MIFYRARRTLTKSFIDTFNYWKVLYRSAGINENKKSIYVEASLFSDAEILSLRKNASSYYRQYLAPKVVVREIEENTYSKLYLQAEEISPYILKKL